MLTLRHILPLLTLVMMAAACSLAYQPYSVPIEQSLEQTSVSSGTQPVILPNDTIPPSTPLPSLTPSRTLLPPPTFEPPTFTPTSGRSPTSAQSPTLALSSPIPGLRGFNTVTPTATYACAPRDDWGQTHIVQPNEYLFAIAQKYHTTAADIAAANCLRNINILSVGQKLTVPGGSPAVESVACTGWEVLTPLNGSMNVPGTGSLTLNWRGPRAPRNLIRILRPNGETYEVVVELRQNETIDLSDISEGGTFTWYVFPLDQNFVQVSCREGGPWLFTKAAEAD